MYGPSGGGKAEFFLKLRELTLQHADGNCLIMGDLNTALDENMDKKNYETDNHKRSRTVINNWIDEGDFIDVFRAFYPDRHSYTYRVQGNQVKRSRLDYALASRDLFGKVTEVKHTHFSSTITDHAGVTVKILLEHHKEGPGSFRAAPLIEKYKMYDASIRHLISQELLELSNLTYNEKVEETENNKKFFDISKKIANKEASEDDEMELATCISIQKTKRELLNAGTEIEEHKALDFIIHKLGRATKNINLTRKS